MIENKNIIETKDLIDKLILGKPKYILVYKNNLETIFGKFYKVNNCFLSETELSLTLVLQENTGSFVDIHINDINSIEILKIDKKYKVVM